MPKTEDARSTLADLERSHAEQQARIHLLDADIKSIALAAETGDAAAKKRILQLEHEKPGLENRLKSIGHAIEAQKRAVAEYEAADQDAADCEKAHRALELLNSFESRGAELDNRLQAFIDEYQQLTSDFHKLDTLKYSPTTYVVVKTVMQRAVSTKLMFTDLRQDFIAPKDRQGFVEAINTWARNIRARAEARLRRNKPTARKAA